MSKKIILIFQIVFVVFVAVIGTVFFKYQPAKAAGNIYYVGPNGVNDSNHGSSSTPFKTIQYAANLVSPGDTVIVQDGTYGGSYPSGYLVYLTRSGTADAPITFRSEHKWGAVLDGNNNTGEVGWGFSSGGASYITVEDFEVAGFSEDGFTSSSGTQNHITLRGNHIHNIGNYDSTSDIGMNGIFDGSTASYMTYDGNVINNIGRTGPPTEQFDLDHGIYTCGTHITITNNIFYDNNAGWDVSVSGYVDSDNVLISNNVFAFGYKRGQIVLWHTCSNVTIQNNIFYDPAEPNAIRYVNAVCSNVIIRNNLPFGGGLTDTPPAGVTLLNNLTEQDPLFVNTATYNFHLQTGSPAIDAGIADSAPTLDFDGNTRPQNLLFDIGAFEYIVTTLPTITKTVDKTSASSGEILTYTINYSNPTANAYTNAKIEDPLPNGTTYVVGSATGGATFDGSKIILKIGNLAAGSSGNIQFQVRVR